MEGLTQSKTIINYLLIINLLNTVDLFLTLFIVKYPANELNPIMRWVWESGTVTFIITKLALTGLMTAIIFIVTGYMSHQNMKILEKMLLAVIGIYSIVPIMHAIMAIGD